MARSGKQKHRPARTPEAPPPTPRSRLRQWLIFIVGIVGLGAAGWYFWREWQATTEAQRGFDLVQERRYLEARDILSKSYQRSPRSATVAANYAQALIHTGAIAADVERVLSRWCELEPDNPEPFKLRMDAWNRLGDRSRALADGLRVLELDPDNDSLRKNVVWLLILTERFDDAERECRRCLEKSPADPALLHLSAQIPFQRGDHREAAERLDALLAKRLDYTPALLLRGIIHNQANPPQYDRAVPLLRKAAADTLDMKVRQSARYQLSQALRGLGDTAEADKVLAEMQQVQEAERLREDAQQQPDNLAIQVQAAEALLATGQVEEGSRMLERVLRRDTRFAAAHRVLADYFEKQGLKAQAAEHRRRAGP
jgi:predicted Zn-dependent protease